MAPRWEPEFYVKPYYVLDVLVVEAYYYLHSGGLYQVQVRFLACCPFSARSTCCVTCIVVVSKSLLRKLVVLSSSTSSTLDKLEAGKIAETNSEKYLDRKRLGKDKAVARDAGLFLYRHTGSPFGHLSLELRFATEQAAAGHDVPPAVSHHRRQRGLGLSPPQLARAGAPAVSVLLRCRWLRQLLPRGGPAPGRGTVGHLHRHAGRAGSPGRPRRPGQRVYAGPGHDLHLRGAGPYFPVCQPPVPGLGGRAAAAGQAHRRSHARAGRPAHLRPARPRVPDGRTLRRLRDAAAIAAAHAGAGSAGAGAHPGGAGGPPAGRAATAAAGAAVPAGPGRHLHPRRPRTGARCTAEGQVDGLVVFAFDVTEQVRARQQVQDLNEKLGAINEELTATNEALNTTNTQLTRTNVDLDTFVYTASHDLKAPITNIEAPAHPRGGHRSGPLHYQAPGGKRRRHYCRGEPSRPRSISGSRSRRAEASAAAVPNGRGRP
nr:hypothetical protein [Tanacetum cinerariifolium]